MRKLILLYFIALFVTHFPMLTLWLIVAPASVVACIYAIWKCAYITIDCLLAYFGA